jgi:hypothetical protein
LEHVGVLVLWRAVMLDASADLPPEFDAGFYRRTYGDLRGMSDAELLAHYQGAGIREGRIGSPVGTPGGFVQLIARARSVLEIGPMAAPMTKGPNVRYFDVLDTEAMKAKAAHHGLDVSQCPEIHYVSETGDLSVVTQPFEAVVSSHAIEHQPDLIAHCLQVTRILEPGGHYFLIVPDKRYCFDHFVAESSIADVIDAHVRKKKFHDVSSIIELTAMGTHNDPVRHWRGDHGEPHFKRAPQKIREAVELFRTHQDVYLDTHAWQFTPASFKEIASLLFELRLVPLRPVRVFETALATLEFCAVLEKTAFPADDSPHDFDGELYLQANPDVRAAGVNAWAHYLEYGRKEGRRLRP